MQGEVSATVLSKCGLFDPRSGEAAAWPAPVLEAAQRTRCSVPAYAQPRGVVARATRTRITRDRSECCRVTWGPCGPKIATLPG